MWRKSAATLGELNQYIGSTGHLASLLRYKLRRVDVSEILSRSHRSADDGEVGYWRNYELDPIASRKRKYQYCQSWLSIWRYTGEITGAFY